MSTKQENLKAIKSGKSVGAKLSFTIGPYVANKAKLYIELVNDESDELISGVGFTIGEAIEDLSGRLDHKQLATLIGL